MKFSNFLNEDVKLKAGDCAIFKDGFGQMVGLLVVGALEHGYVATCGGMIGVWSPKSIHKFRLDQLDSCVWIDDNGRVYGKYPITLFKGSFEEFLNKLEEIGNDV